MREILPRLGRSAWANPQSPYPEDLTTDYTDGTDRIAFFAICEICLIRSSRVTVILFVRRKDLTAKAQRARRNTNQFRFFFARFGLRGESISSRS
jgi:hypothetical protein